MFTAFNELMNNGGPVMWVIFVTAWIAIVMLIERAIRIQQWHSAANADQSQFENTPDFLPARPEGTSGSPAAVILHRLDQSNGDRIQQINIQLAELMPKLEGTLPTIAVLGSLLPMLGLLGTVTGMINVFEVVAVHGTGNPQEMAYGISQALLTTASGLIIAIPVIFSHHLLSRRLGYILAVTEQSLQHIQQKDLTSLHSGSSNGH